MRSTTAREFRAGGGVYPDPARTAFGDYSAFRGEALGDDDALTTLVRLPAPAVLRAMLGEDAPFSLHGPGFDAVFVGDPEQIWSWPGVDRFGAVALLDPWPLSPVRATGFDGYLIDARQPIDPETTVYVPDRETCRAVAPARTWVEAEPLLPSDYVGRLAEKLAAIDRYIADVARLGPTLDALAADTDDARALRAEFALEDVPLDGPIYRLDPDVMRRIEAAHASFPEPR